MRWTPGRRSPNIVDRRGARGVAMPLGIAGAVAVLVLSLLTGRNLFSDLDGDPTTAASGGALAPADSAREEPTVQFVSFVADLAG